MKRRRRAQTVSLALNLAPLVDVMMCLLIFFMLATKLIERRQAAVDLPESRIVRPVWSESDAGRFVINVTTEADRVRYQLDELRVSPAELADRLEEAADQNPELTCYIRAGRDIEFRHIEPILAECARLRVARVTFAATRAEERGT